MKAGDTANLILVVDIPRGSCYNGFFLIQPEYRRLKSCFLQPVVGPAHGLAALVRVDLAYGDFRNSFPPGFEKKN